MFYDEGLGFRPLRTLGKTALFVLLWNISAYCYTRALQMKPALDVMTLFATNSSFVYLLSWIVLHKQFMSIRVQHIGSAVFSIYIIYIQQ